MGGTYTLLVELAEPAGVTFGTAGERDLEAGWYAYTGSALGTGGFARVDRHYRVAAGDHGVRHWHVDYLLGHDAARLADVIRSAGVDAECAVASRIAGSPEIDPVRGAGATDCECGSHLAFAHERPAIQRAVTGAHRRARG